MHPCRFPPLSFGVFCMAAQNWERLTDAQPDRRRRRDMVPCRQGSFVLPETVWGVQRKCLKWGQWDKQARSLERAGSLHACRAVLLTKGLAVCSVTVTTTLQREVGRQDSYRGGSCPRTQKCSPLTNSEPKFETRNPGVFPNTASCTPWARDPPAIHHI